MEEHPHVSIRDLAARLGIGRSAVSMALRNHPHISEATRLRVQAEAERLGYRPNAMVTALMSQVRTRRVKRSGETIAYLSAFKTKEEWKHSTLHDGTLLGAQARAERLGFRVEPYWLGYQGGEAARVARVLRARAVRGVIVGPMPLDLGPVELDWGNIFAAAIGYSFGQQHLDRISHNHFNIMRLCYESLYRRGHRRIGLSITQESDDRVQHLWMAGFDTSRKLLKGSMVPPLWLEHWEDHPDSKKRFEKWYWAHKPDAVIGMGGDNPLHWMRAMGVDVPKNTSYSNLDLAHLNQGKVAGVLQNVRAAGASAVDWVVAGINRNEYGVPDNPKSLLMEATWSDGPTVGPRSVPARKKSTG
ncbi:MAG: LacI family DNA-binding transcriptional regulator [Opitutaceae bacterium]|jgi:LacI family transcriptional regulator